MSHRAALVSAMVAAGLLAACTSCDDAPTVASVSTAASATTASALTTVPVPTAPVPTIPATTTPATTPPTSPLGTSTTAPATQTERRIVDLTWISNDSGWALVSDPCPGGVCLSLTGTSDGGASWRAIGKSPIPDTSHPSRCADIGCVSHVRFANTKVGYLFGPDLFMSTDGGNTWSRQQLDGPDVEVRSLAIRGTSVLMANATFGLPGPLDLFRSTVGTNHWLASSHTEAGGEGADVLWSGPTAIVAFVGRRAGGGENAQTDFMRSADNGVNWQLFGDPCPIRSGEDGGEWDAVPSATGPDGLLASVCSPRGTRGTFTIRVSQDDGVHFGPELPLPLNGQQYVSAVAITSPENIVIVVSPDNTVYRSTNGGYSWTLTLDGPESPWQSQYYEQHWLGFESTTTGRVAFGTDAVWTTRDGGDTWTKSTVST